VTHLTTKTTKIKKVLLLLQHVAIMNTFISPKKRQRDRKKDRQTEKSSLHLQTTG